MTQEVTILGLHLWETWVKGWKLYSIGKGLVMSSLQIVKSEYDQVSYYKMDGLVFDYNLCTSTPHKSTLSYDT